MTHMAVWCIDQYCKNQSIFILIIILTQLKVETDKFSTFPLSVSSWYYCLHCCRKDNHIAFHFPQSLAQSSFSLAGWTAISTPGESNCKELGVKLFSTGDSYQELPRKTKALSSSCFACAMVDALPVCHRSSLYFHGIFIIPSGRKNCKVKALAFY